MVGFQDLLAKLSLNIRVEGEMPEAECQGVPRGLVSGKNHQEEGRHNEELDFLYCSWISILIKTAWPYFWINLINVSTLMWHIGMNNCASIIKPYFVIYFPSVDALPVLLLLSDGVNHEIYHVISPLHSSRFPHCNDMLHLI